MTLWAASPLLHNPTNIDIDRDGRIWVAEGVRYRSHHARQPEGDRIVVLQDTDGDGKADKTHTFVQEPGLIAPLGVAVIDNKVIVSQPPDLIVYTDVDRNLRFDPAVDKREVLLTGFQGINHDHSLHSVTFGPDGKWIFNSGNTGGMFTDKSGKTFRIFGSYRPNPVGPFTFPNDPAVYAGKPSDDGHVYVGGFTVRMNPDGTNAEIIGYNYRNSYEQSVSSLGDVFQNDNDDPPACRVSWVMEYANFGFSSNDGQRTWQADRRAGQSIPVAEWRQDDPGMMPAGDVYGGGSPTGNVFYENGALGPAWDGTFLAADAGRNEVFAYKPARQGGGFALDRKIFLTSNVKQQYAGSDFVGGNNTAKGAMETLFRPSDIAVGPDGALYVSDWIDARVGGHVDLDDTLSGAIYRIAPKGFVSKVPAFDPATIDGLITALRSPAVNVRAIGFEGLKARGAAAVSAVAGLLNDPNPYMRGRAIFLLYQMGPEGQKRAGSPESITDPALRIAAYRAMRRANLDVLPVAAALARDQDAGVRREVAVSMRDQSADKSLNILVDVARGFDGQDRSYLEALGTGATGKEPALYDRLRKELGVKDDPLAWSGTFTWIAWRLHVPAAVTDLTARARVVEAVARRSQARPGYARLHQGSGRVQSHARVREAGEHAAGAGDGVAVESHVERLVGLRAGTRPQDGRHLRSRFDHVPRGDRAASAGGSPRALGRRDRPSHRRLRTGEDHRAALPHVPRDRRHRGRVWTGTGRLGTRQVCRRGRDGPRPPERGDRARLRERGAQDEGRRDDSGRPHQGRRSSDDAQHGRDHPSHSCQPHRGETADAGVAHDERRAAGTHAAGCRRPRGVPAGELIAAASCGWQDRAHCGRGRNHTGFDADRKLPLNSAARRRSQLRDEPVRDVAGKSGVHAE